MIDKTVGNHKRRISKMPEIKTTIVRMKNRMLDVPLVILLIKIERRRITRVINEHISKVIILGIRILFPF